MFIQTFIQFCKLIGAFESNIVAISKNQLVSQKHISEFIASTFYHF